MSRTAGICRDCAQPRPLHAHGRCAPCDRRWRRESAKQPCPRCGRPGLLRPGTGICGRCQRALRPRRPPAPPRQVTCVRCGQRGPHQAHGLCARCYHHDPAMVGNCAARLAQNLDHPPGWLDGFAGYLEVRLSPGRAVTLLHQLAGVLASSSSNAPAAVLAAAGQPRPGRPAGGALTRALEAFFTSARLALPADTAAQAARPAAAGASRRPRSRSAQPLPASAMPSCATATEPAGPEPGPGLTAPWRSTSPRSVTSPATWPHHGPRSPGGS